MSSLERFLKLCDIDHEKVNVISNEYANSIENFTSGSKRWSTLGLNQQEITRILKWKRKYHQAEIDCEEYKIQAVNFPDKYSSDEESFYNNYKEEIEAGIDEAEKALLREIYKLAFEEHFTANKSLAIRSIGNFGVFVTAIINKAGPLFDLVKANPKICTGLASTVDEIFSIVLNFSLGDVIRLNAYSELILLGAFTAWSIGKHMYELVKGKINFKEFLILVGVDLAANISVCVTGFGLATAGGFIGTLVWPGVGTFIGAILGSLAGGILGKKCIEPKVRKFFQDQNLKVDSFEMKTSDDLYEYALDKLNVTRSTDSDRIKQVRRNYLLAYHPDKNAQIEKQQTDKLIELERCFQIVKKYREAKGEWTGDNN